MPSETATLGAAGEHYVLFQLLRRGFIAALAPHGVPMADIIVTDGVGERLFAIQVKTRREKGADNGWHMKAKHEEISSPSLFYCFVDVGKVVSDVPFSYVVPSAIVASVLKETYQAWLHTPGKTKPHQDHELRRFVPDFTRYFCPKYADGWLTQYREAWDLLKATTGVA